MLLLSHISSHIIHLFFYLIFPLFKLLYSPYLKKKKKKLFFSLLVHIYSYASSNISPQMTLFLQLFFSLLVLIFWPYFHFGPLHFHFTTFST